MKAIHERACVPFLGAAVNISDEKENQSLPVGGDVALRLIGKLTGVTVEKIEDLAKVVDIREELKAAGLAEDLARLNFQNLPRVALHVEVQSAMRRAYLLQLIREILHDEDRRPSKILRLLARLPFNLIVTTNFDRLLERALELAVKESVPITVKVLSHPENLIFELRDTTNPLSVYLKSQFPSDTQQLLEAHDETTQPADELLSALAQGLNEQLLNEDLFEKNRFAMVFLKKELRTRARLKVSGDERMLLNRQLLEAAYSDLARSRSFEVFIQDGDDKEGHRVDKHLSELPEETTIVYKFHGSFQKDEEVSAQKRRQKKKPSKLIITEEDYIHFLTTIGKKEGGIPVKISGSMVRGTMLFLGYSLEDWDFRTIFKGLIESQENDDGRTSFAIQLNPPKFWEDYWRHKGVITYDYDINRFAEDLEKRYVETYGSLWACKSDK